MTALPTAMESRAEITDLVHRYAYYMRHRQWSAFPALFADDGEFILCEGGLGDQAPAIIRTHTIGRAKTVEFIQISGESMVLCPMIHNLLIEIDGAKARSTCIMENRTWPATSSRIGEYEDIYCFEKGQWLFCKRIFTMFLD